MIELLIGPIASGKSTYSLKRAREGAIIVNDDSIVTSLHGGDYQLYNKQLKVLYKQIEFVTISSGHILGRDIVIDRTNLDKNTRRRYIEIARSLDTDIIGIVFKNEGPEIHGSRRFNSDSRRHSLEQWIKVANTHQMNYQEPSLDEGFKTLKDYK